MSRRRPQALRGWRHDKRARCETDAYLARAYPDFDALSRERRVRQLGRDPAAARFMRRCMPRQKSPAGPADRGPAARQGYEHVDAPVRRARNPLQAVPEPLDPLRFPLHGSRLIEASAGTGKTFTIATLYVRLVLGHGAAGRASRAPSPRPRSWSSPSPMPPPRSCASASASRLARPRAVSATTRPAWPQRPAGEDPLHDLRAEYPPEQWPACARKLQLAAEWMDEAAVSTIHAWCNRMLREHAFDSDSLFTQTLETDQSELLRRGGARLLAHLHGAARRRGGRRGPPMVVRSGGAARWPARSGRSCRPARGRARAGPRRSRLRARSGGCGWPSSRRLGQDLGR